MANHADFQVQDLAGGKLSVLFITPYSASREIVEAAQRLDMTVAWIMNASNWHWTDGYRQGIGATPLQHPSWCARRAKD